ncbi:TPA: hypothetical protein EYQ19_00145 [Candidatus Pacearchaeota archaeon]|jgi:hypothetical protein|nr:hypothetical protein [Candidatus Pacearchaeota archaeon]
MGFLNRKKNSVDVIDFTNLQKRGIIKKKEENSEIDFSKPSVQRPSSSTNDFGFLSSLAGANSTGNPQESANNFSNKKNELNEIKIKMEDNEFKLNNLVEKVNELEAKLRELKS